MTADFPSFQFRSDLFHVDPKEDEETNPFCYGQSLAEWVRAKFIELGYEPEPVIAEDWGWCVMLTREPFPLWIGCGNERGAFYDSVSPDEKASFAPDGREITWSCLVSANVPCWCAFFWKRLLGRASTKPYVDAVSDQLRTILLNEARIALVDGARG